MLDRQRTKDFEARTLQHCLEEPSTQRDHRVDERRHRVGSVCRPTAWPNHPAKIIPSFVWVVAPLHRLLHHSEVESITKLVGLFCATTSGFPKSLMIIDMTRKSNKFVSLMCVADLVIVLSTIYLFPRKYRRSGKSYGDVSFSSKKYV